MVIAEKKAKNFGGGGGGRVVWKSLVAVKERRKKGFG